MPSSAGCNRTGNIDLFRQGNLLQGLVIQCTILRHARGYGQRTPIWALRDRFGHGYRCTGRHFIDENICQRWNISQKVLQKVVTAALSLSFLAMATILVPGLMNPPDLGNPGIRGRLMHWLHMMLSAMLFMLHWVRGGFTWMWIGMHDGCGLFDYGLVYERSHFILNLGVNVSSLLLLLLNLLPNLLPNHFQILFVIFFFIFFFIFYSTFCLFIRSITRSRIFSIIHHRKKAPSSDRGR